MKCRTAAAIVICLTNGAIAAPTQSNQLGVATHNNALVQPRQPAEDFAELSETTQNAISSAGRQSRQKRDDIEVAAGKALAQTSRFTQEDTQEENVLDLQVNLDGPATVFNKLKARREQDEKKPEDKTEKPPVSDPAKAKKPKLLNLEKLLKILNLKGLTKSLGPKKPVDDAKAPTADKAKFTVSARSFRVNQKKPAAE